ncbi:peptidoglycan-binding protein [Streptomyces sp. NPDC008125]|uniref:peptidoglycan-binding protein n=1 Tax=Streptomyces sp. NPDC008125 TaxID=3364811 RepID=UPI0036EA09D1
MTDILTQLGSVAKAEVGYHEGKTDGHWNNKEKYAAEVPGLAWADYQAWCATFVSWVALKAGAADLFPRTASCAAGVAWFKGKGRFSAYPAVGAQVFYGAGGGTHTGLVYAYDADYIYTYEGNTNDNGSAEGDGVYAKKRARRDAYTYGYGYPALSGGLSADPGAAKFGYKVAASAKIAEPVTAPVATKLEPFPGAAYFKGKPKSAIITAMGKRLVAEKCSAYKSGPGAQWTDADKASYAKWQKKQGFKGADADGWPGKATWDALKVPKV